MILSSLVGYCVGAGFIFEGVRQYVCSNEYKLKKRINLAFKRAGIFIQTKSIGGKNVNIELPKFLELLPIENGWYLQYLLPVGLTEDDINKNRMVIESATSSEMVAWTDGQILHLELYMNKIPDTIGFNDDLMSEISQYPLAIAMGYGRRGLEVINYAKVPNPHMFIAGASGGGKSNALNSIILQLVHNPNVRLFLADPKLVEFSEYRGARNVERVETDLAKINQMVVEVLKITKDREKKGIKNIFQYNAHNENKEPYVFLIIDEIADFHADDEKFWEPVKEIGRKGRSSGVFLIICTQRPSADVIPPTLKSNLLLKLAFKTSTLSNSRVILDTDAAFKLPSKAGRAIIENGYQRQIQVPLVKDDQVRAILAKLRTQSEGDSHDKSE